jgi:leucyl aminopeptidase
MQFSTKTFDASSSTTINAGLASINTDCLLLAIAADDSLDAIGKALDTLCNGAISRALASGDLPKRQAGTMMTITGYKNISRVLLVRLSAASPLTEKDFISAVRSAAKAVNQSSASECASLLALAASKSLSVEWTSSTESQVFADTNYRFEAHKSVKSKAGSVTKWTALVSPAHLASVKQALKQAQAIADGIRLAKDLGNTPGNICTPHYLAQTAQDLAKNLPLRVEVLEEKQMRKLGMGSLLAVAQGSVQAPKLIVLHYSGGKARQAPHVLVGKGITFDTGGISIKPAAEMDEMKFDMCGAASVLGTLLAVAQLKLPINVIGVVPACENMPSGNAVKPGDVVTSMSGQTIEVLNTDAEGRLILCDALTYAARFKPASMIDIATLTGACVIALGHHHTGLFSRDQSLSTALQSAGQYAADTCWPMPLDDEYQDQLKSNFADMGNVGGRAGGSITAACFLSRFVGDIPWAHLDIAGTAWRSGAAKGGTGRPVGLLTRYLINASA